MSVLPLVKGAIEDLLVPLTVGGGTLEYVAVSYEPPEKLEDVKHPLSADGSSDGVWMAVDNSGTIEPAFMFGGSTLCLEERWTLTMYVQAIRASGTQEAADTAAHSIAAAVIAAIAADRTVGVDLATNNLDLLEVLPGPVRTDGAFTSSGGSDPGHASLYVLEISVHAQYQTP